MMNYRRVTSVSGVLLVFGLLIGGCGDPQTVDSAEVDASQSLQSEDVIEKQSLRTVSSDELSSSDLADASSEQTLDELVAAWEDVTGESCALESSDSTEFGATSLSCDSATVLSTYESTTGLRQQLKSADELFKMADMQGSRLVGINWGMNVDATLIEDLHEHLGGIRVDLGS